MRNDRAPPVVAAWTGERVVAPLLVAVATARNYKVRISAGQ